MQTYPVRPDHRRNLTVESLLALAKEQFDQTSVEDGVVRSSFGALERLLVKPEGRQLWVDVRMDPKVPNEVARATIDRYNAFLEAVTGYSAKERARRLRKTPGE